LNAHQLELLVKRGNIEEIRLAIPKHNLLPNNLLNIVDCNINTIKFLVDEAEAYTFSHVIQMAIKENRIDVLKYVVEKIYDKKTSKTIKSMYITEIILSLIINIDDKFKFFKIVHYDLKIKNINYVDNYSLYRNYKIYRKYKDYKDYFKRIASISAANHILIF